MAEDLLPILTRFHREILLPDVERVVANAVEGSERRLRDEMQTGFDALAQRLNRLETEYHVRSFLPVVARISATLRSKAVARAQSQSSDST